MYFFPLRSVYNAPQTPVWLGRGHPSPPLSPSSASSFPVGPRRCGVRIGPTRWLIRPCLKLLKLSEFLSSSDCRASRQRDKNPDMQHPDMLRSKLLKWWRELPKNYRTCLSLRRPVDDDTSAKMTRLVYNGIAGGNARSCEVADTGYWEAPVRQHHVLSGHYNVGQCDVQTYSFW